MKSHKVAISPSMLSADPLHLAKELADVEAAGADFHHVDVMDGHFVNNLTYGPPMVQAIKKVSKIPLDVHIMVSNPDEVALEYVRAGADILIFHVEAARHSHRLIQAIRTEGAKAGIALNPGTPLSAVESLIPFVDVILVMSVNPGFGGQSFIPQSVDRIKTLAEMIKKQGRQGDVVIQVDGGIDEKNVAQVVQAGARMIVAGSFIYGAKDRRAQIEKLRNNAHKDGS